MVAEGVANPLQEIKTYLRNAVDAAGTFSYAFTGNNAGGLSFTRFEPTGKPALGR
jgi:hypothetical protein